MKQLRPFRFGITSHVASTREDWIATARKVEAQGYSSLVVCDHLMMKMGPIAALVAAADATTTLRLGSYMFANDFRHPVFLAQETASIDLLSNGRFELGLGTGWLHLDYKQSGIPFDSPGIRVARMQEAVQVIKGMWSEGSFDYSGTYYQIKGLNGLPKPAQKPRPPLMIGGGTQRILSFAAREADIVGINFKSTREGGAELASILPEAIDQKVQWIREAAAERFDSLELNNYAFIAAITDKRYPVAQESLKSYGIAADETNLEDWIKSPMVLIGTVDQVVDDLLMRRERFGISYVTLRESVADAFAPVVERLAGK